jgi:hypothetical protein
MPNAVTRPVVALGLLILLLPQSASAQLQSLQTSQIDIHGTATATGDLTGVLFEQADCSHLTLRITAAAAHIAVDESTDPVSVANVGSLEQEIHNTTFQDYAESQIRITGTADCRIVATALATPATYSVQPRSLGSAGTGKLSFTPHANNTRPHPTIPLDGALGVQPTGDIRLEGGLRIAVWGADVDAADPKQERRFQTGAFQEPLDGLPDNPLVWKTVQREAFMDLTGAAVTLAAPDASTLVAATARTVMESGYLEATGQLPGTADQSIHIEAPLEIESRAADGVLQSQVLGAHGLDVGGKPVTPKSDVGPFAAAATLLATCAVLALVGLAVRDRQTIERLLHDERYEDVLARARRTSWLPVGAWRTRIAEAVAQIKLGLVLDASRNLERRRWRRTPVWHYLMASLEALRQAPQKAQEHLAESMATAPGYRTEAEANPLLRDHVPAALRIATRRRQEIMDAF